MGTDVRQFRGVPPEPAKRSRKPTWELRMLRIIRPGTPRAWYVLALPPESGLEIVSREHLSQLISLFFSGF